MNRPPDIPGTIAAIQLQPIFDGLARMGIDVARALAIAGLSADAIRDPQARLAAGIEFAAWDAAEAITGDPLIGLRIADQVHVGALGALEYLMRNSPSLRVAAERAGRFERVLDDLTRISLIEEGEHAIIRLWREGGYPHPPRGLECIFAVLVRIGGELGLGAPSEVRFSHPAIVEPALFERSLRSPVRFGASYDEIVFARELLDVPLRAADPRLGSVLEEHLQRMLEMLPNEDRFVTRARGALLRALRARAASLENLAAALAVSPRTLRRRLDERGTSYRALLDEIRRELAYHCIERSDEPFDSIASQLGFTEPSTFYRAFKRWSGTTPALFRERKKS